MVKAAFATTQDPGQEPPSNPCSSERQEGIHQMPTLTPDPMDLDAIGEGTIWNLSLGIKRVADLRGRNSGQWITDQQTLQWPAEPELDVISGRHQYAPETANTFTPGMPVFLYFEEIDLRNQRLREVLGRSSSGPLAAESFKVPHVARFVSSENRSSTTVPLWATLKQVAYLMATLGSPQETPVLDERSRRIADIEETLRRFSELPENWDSYGGRAISLDAIGEAKRILMAAIDLNLPEPWVAPGGDAGIGIQWDTDRAELYIDVVPDEETTYVLTPKAGNVGELDGVLTKANLLGVLNHLAESAT